MWGGRGEGVLSHPPSPSRSLSLSLYLARPRALWRVVLPLAPRFCFIHSLSSSSVRQTWAGLSGVEDYMREIKEGLEDKHVKEHKVRNAIRAALFGTDG